ncbi:MAG: (d)CMP kinase [Clostridiales bacterium]|nr:(d)CMP kinase [Clostridiales bacterium]
MMQIAIDGPSGSGKSTIAKEVAARLGLIYLDTGALYRAAGLAAQNLGADLDDEAAVLAIMDDFEFDPKENSALRTAEAGLLASAVGRHPGVRAKIVKIIQDLAAGQNIIMDGRDIGTVVLPDAPVKIFLTASVEARATRRVHELNLLNQPADFDDIAAQIKARDHQDTTRAASPLKMAEDAQLLDCSEMDINQTVEAILEIIG